jgi:hypothetical protein
MALVRQSKANAGNRFGDRARAGVRSGQKNFSQGPHQKSIPARHHPRSVPARRNLFVSPRRLGSAANGGMLTLGRASTRASRAPENSRAGSDSRLENTCPFLCDRMQAGAMAPNQRWYCIAKPVESICRLVLVRLHSNNAVVPPSNKDNLADFGNYRKREHTTFEIALASIGSARYDGNERSPASSYSNLQRAYRHRPAGPSI